MKSKTRQPICPLQNSNIKNTIVFTSVATLWLCSANSPRACGPDFPNNLLDRGDAAVLYAPHSVFSSELIRMGFARNLGATNISQVDAELNDLSAALKKKAVPAAAAAAVYASVAAMRRELADYEDKFNAWEVSGEWVFDGNGSHRAAPPGPEPAFPTLTIPKDLPEEFQRYFDGAKIWRNHALTNKTAARSAWESVLALPAAERRYKSTWAAYMLGRFSEKEDPEKAAEFYQQVRALARQGFADSALLKVQSLGYEARIKLHQADLESAIDLYLQQCSAGEMSAFESLRITAERALSSPLLLPSLAMNPRAQKVITAYVSSLGNPREDDAYEGSPESHSSLPAIAWLDAVEAAGVSDVDSADKLALAAYQNNQPATAQRWLKRAGNSPVAEWIRVKLLLRAGKVAEATALLTKVIDAFPTEPWNQDNPDSRALTDHLWVGRGNYSTTASRMVRGELGVIHLARREYVESLDCLMQGGFWMDAAYVAERVLSIDELKTYVDSFCPAGANKLTNEDFSYRCKFDTQPAEMNQNLRYLLARRLTRANRGNESRPYYPPYWLDSFDGLVQALRDGWSETLPQSDRAAALRKAAFITRTNGMELLGTEMEPDWSIHDGNFEGELTWANRSTNQFDAKIVPAAREEIIRASHRNPDPDERFHYRYQAAFLGWSAASLMTNNTDECAQMLCVAGTWLKQRDPDTADVFYKALVLRNRQTPLGKEADVKRWFPRMDRTGNRIEERQPENEAIVNHLMTGDTEPDDPGTIEIIDPNADTDQTSGPPPDAYEYIVRSGDTLVRISQIISAAGNPVSVQDLQDCNQLMTPSRLRIGQKLIIPFRGDTVQN